MPEARIIVIIRDQFSIISSIYKQYIKEGGTKSFSKYLKGGVDGRLPLFDWQPLRYAELIQLYISKFGKERVKIILAEDLFSEPKRTLDDLCSFFGIPKRPYPAELLRPTNVGISEAEIERARLQNLFYAKRNSLKDPTCLTQNPLKAMIIRGLVELEPNSFIEKRTLVQEAKKLLGGNFKESNKKLSTLLGRDLTAVGYE